MTLDPATLREITKTLRESPKVTALTGHTMHEVNGEMFTAATIKAALSVLKTFNK